MLAAGSQAAPAKGPRKPFQDWSSRNGLCPSWPGAYLAQQVEKTHSGAKNHIGNLGHPW